MTILTHHGPVTVTRIRSRWFAGSSTALVCGPSFVSALETLLRELAGVPRIEREGVSR